MVFNQTSFSLVSRFETKILFGLIMGVLSVITSIGNILVIYRYRKASMVGNLFIISLACADLIVGSFVMPIATAYAITETWNMSLPLCLIWLSADYTASTASILNLLNLSLDRYWSITTPLKYLGKRTKSRALIMISLAWSLSLLWLVPIFAWPYIFNDSIRYVPHDKCNTEYDKNIVFKVTTAIINFYLPLFVLISINTKIYLVIRSRYRNPIMNIQYSSQVPKNSTTNNYLSDSYSISPANSFFSTSNKPNRKNSSIKCRNNTPNFHNNSIKSSYNFSERNNIELIPEKKVSTSSTSLYLENKGFFQSISFLNNMSFKSKKSSNNNEMLLSSNKTKNLESQKKPSIKFSRENSKYNTSHDFTYSNTLKNSMINNKLKSDEIKIKQNDGNECFFEKSSQSSKNSKFSSPINNSKNFNKGSCLEVKPKNSTCSSSMEKLKVPQFDNLDEIKKKMTSKKGDKHKQKLFMNKQEKAFKQLAAIVIGFTLCFLPYFIVFLIVAMCEECISENVFTASVWLGYINSTLNPFLYAISNKRFFKRKSKRRRQEIHNKTSNVNFF